MRSLVTSTRVAKYRQEPEPKAMKVARYSKFKVDELIMLARSIMIVSLSSLGIQLGEYSTHETV